MVNISTEYKTNVNTYSTIPFIGGWKVGKTKLCMVLDVKTEATFG